MASVTGVWWREGKQLITVCANSGDADSFIRRNKSKCEGNNGSVKTLDKVTLTV